MRSTARPRRWTTDPSTHLPTLLRKSRVYRSPNDRRLARRVDLLLRVLDFCSPCGVGQAHLHPLALLAGIPWAREPDTLQRSQAATFPLRALADHLVRLVRYPLPDVLYDLVFGGAPSDDRRRAALVLARMGRGEGLRALSAEGLVLDLPRASHHAVFHLRAAPTLTAAFRSAHALACGGDLALADALGGTRLRDRQPDDARWNDVVAWMARERLDPSLVGVVVDWAASTGRPVRGRSVDAVVSAAQTWHAAPRRAAVALHALPRPPWDSADCDGVFRVVWLGSGAALVDEGAALGHCVATYEALARAGVCSLWSLRRGDARCVTIEVRHAERAVVQVRGPSNRMPTPEERAAVQVWAAGQGVRIERW